MAAELYTPIDPTTRLPALIAPQLEWLPLDNPDIADRHHPWNPHRFYKSMNAAGIALRGSLVQIVERTSHNEGPNAFHNFYKEPAEKITDEKDIFERVITACSGVVPRLVVEIKDGEPCERPINHKEEAFFTLPSDDDTDQFSYRHLCYRYEPVRDFLRSYVLEQELPHLRPSLIDEFLDTKDKHRKQKIGTFLIYNAISVASDDAREQYYRLRRKGLMHPGMPREIHTLVSYKLGSRDQYFGLVQRLEQLLRSSAASNHAHA